MIASLSFGDGDTVHLLLTLSVLLVVVHAMGFLFVKLRQPRVAGEIIAGLALGPTLLGFLNPGLTHELIAGNPSTTAVLGALYQLGQLLLMYCAGATLQSHRRRGEGRTTTLIALTGNVAPFAAGAAFLLVLNPSGLIGAAGNRASLLIVFACGIAVTSIPVISRILADLGLMKTSFARTVLTVALVDDVILYVLLSIAVGLVATDSSDSFALPSLLSIHPGSALSDVYYVIASLAIFGIPLAFGRSFVERMGAMRFNVLGRSNALAFQVVFMMAMTSLALFIGVSPIFGAFVSGILAGTLSGNQEGKSTVSIDAARAQASIQSFSFAFFVPIYFAIVGLKLDLIRDFNIPFFALFLVYACVVKALSIYAGARLAGEKREGAIHLAMALNARGGPAIVMASVALDARIISESFYVDLVLLALVTSMIAGAWLDRAIRRGTFFAELHSSGRGSYDVERVSA
ncbi:MAG TPA: cation:proton antiporter [Candidatus Acidoferrales bacterium]|nr:cation:proton antiporter [Candidatus Acidoferrales bacterium]